MVRTEGAGGNEELERGRDGGREGPDPILLNKNDDD
mgnify:CR=1 FL=1